MCSHKTLLGENNIEVVACLRVHFVLHHAVRCYVTLDQRLISAHKEQIGSMLYHTSGAVKQLTVKADYFDDVVGLS